MAMDLNYQMLLTIAGFTTAIGTAIYTVQKVTKNFKSDKQEFKAEILQEAKEEDAKHKLEIEVKIKNIEMELQNLRDNIQKDLSHMKETYNGEIRNLGHKIEDLRSELRNQHGQLVQLLTEMVKNRD
jgi:uncharacterized protein YPO0396